MGSENVCWKFFQVPTSTTVFSLELTEPTLIIISETFVLSDLDFKIHGGPKHSVLYCWKN